MHPRDDEVIMTTATADTLPALRPIGRIATPFRTLKDCPRNGRQRDPAPVCHVTVFDEFRPGLASIEGFSHLILVYALHEVRGMELQFTPPFDASPRGIFATRGPWRPNPLGLSVVAFDGVASQGVLKVRYLDCLDGTPLLDIKPYLPSTDSEPDATMGWLEKHRTR
jgi:tRNA-Thr(GGU) m(6)t(6)A37 methyltransferase TsaA